MAKSHPIQSGSRGSERAYLRELRRVFAERERSIREEVRASHRSHLDFLERRGVTLGGLRQAGARHLTTGALASLLAISPISASAHLGTGSAQHPGTATVVTAAEDINIKLSAELQKILPGGSGNLTVSSEAEVSRIIARVLGFRATSELDGYRLNRTMGLIGAEQHLYRYPGDNIFEHATTSSEFAMYGGAGIAPGLGAYGYWARSKAALTSEMIQEERWYVVAQTFLSPQFKSNPRATVNFFKYRKFVVINPDSGQALVGDLADAGPAEYTGKSFGGSPEVMHFLGYGSGPRKGRVLFFFLDDPQNRIPLGPVTTTFGGS